MNDDVRRLLEEAGRREVPPVDPGYADALETRLRSVATSLPAGAPGATGATGAEPPGPPRRRPAAGWWLAGVGAALTVIVLAVLAGPLRPSGEPTPVPASALVSPVHVEVILPNGEVLEDPDGLLLPPGAVVRVGEGGSARIGEAMLGPGDIATVGDDRVVIEYASPQGVVTGSAPARTAGPGATARPPTPTPAPTRAPGASASPTTRPAPTATPARPAPTATPARPPTPAPTATPDEQPVPTRTPAPPEPTPTPTATASPTPTPTPPILRPRLRARLIIGPRIAVTWTETRNARSYVLLVTASRTGAAPDPVYPGSRILGEFVAPPERPLRYRVPAGVTELKVQVMALRGNGTVLRRSRIVTIAIPQANASPSGDLAGDSPTPDPASSPTPGPSLPTVP